MGERAAELHAQERARRVEDALTGDVLARWEDAPWPGNVRELRNAVARRLALGDLAPSVEAASPRRKRR